jgi:hypothetical protein
VAREREGGCKVAAIGGGEMEYGVLLIAAVIAYVVTIVWIVASHEKRKGAER